MRHGAVLLFLLWVGMSGLFPGISQAGEAHGPWSITIEELIGRALTENPELQASRAEVEAARGRHTQAGLRPNPMLDVGFQKTVTGPDNNFTTGVTLPLDLNGRRAVRVGVSAREIDLKHAQVAERERELRAEVRLKAGELLHSRVEVARLQLCTVVGLEPESPISVRGELRLRPVTLDRKDALATALTSRPDILMSRAESAMAGAKVRKEEAEGRWDASVNVGYMRQDFGYDLSGLTDRGELRPISDVFHYVGGGVTVTLPVLNRNQGNIASALAEAQAAGRREESMTLMVKQDISAAFTQYEAAERALSTYTRGVWELSRENLSVVRKAYALGRHPLLDVIAEERRSIEVEMGYTDMLKHAYDAAVEIERAVGVWPH